MSDTPRTDALEKRWPRENFAEMSTLARDLERENARLREALEWFADFHNYEDTVAHNHLPVWSEGIQRAKAALAKEEK